MTPKIQLAQASAIDLNALAKKPSRMVIIVNFEGTGLTEELFLERLSELVAAVPSKPPAHKLRPDSYKNFLAARRLADDADSAALYDTLAAASQDESVSVTMPSLCWKLLWVPEQQIGNAADLAATTRQQLERRLLRMKQYNHDRDAVRDVDYVDDWLMTRFGIKLPNEEAETKNHQD